MRPFLERVLPQPGASWSMLDRRLDDGIPFQWHHHQEMELTLTLNSRGQRFVGDHVGDYGDGDLVLVGPNLPHTWSSSAKLDARNPHVALVLWFRQEFIDQLVRPAVELKEISALLARAATGLRFSDEASAAVAHDVEQLFRVPPSTGLLGLLDLLHRLTGDPHSESLSSVKPPLMDPTEGRERIDRVLVHIHAAYAQDLRMDDLAGIAALSISGLHRMFRRHTATTVSEYLIRLRIGDACARLSATSQPVRWIASEVGYASMANFNRHFRRLRGMTPRDYRATFQRRQHKSGDR